MRTTMRTPPDSYFRNFRNFRNTAYRQPLE